MQEIAIEIQSLTRRTVLHSATIIVQQGNLDQLATVPELLRQFIDRQQL